MTQRMSLAFVAALGLAVFATSAHSARVVRTVAAQDTVSRVAAAQDERSVVINSVPLPPRGPVRPPVRPPSRR